MLVWKVVVVTQLYRKDLWGVPATKVVNNYIENYGLPPLHNE